MEATEYTASVRLPWNKGKLVGEKTPFSKRSGPFAFDCSSPSGGANSPFSIWPSTANFEPVTSLA